MALETATAAEMPAHGRSRVAMPHIATTVVVFQSTGWNLQHFDLDIKGGCPHLLPNARSRVIA